MGATDDSAVPTTIFQHIARHPYHGFVLVMVTIVYLLNQLDRYLYGVVTIPFIDYKGSEYGLIAGPLFTVIYTIMGVVIAHFGGANAKHRKALISISLIVWSLATALTGLAKSFGLVAVARILQGIGEAGCTPFATAIIADFFPKAVLGTAISFYNVGIYTGYSLALGLGTTLSTAFGPEHWQYSYYLFGAVGIVVAVVFFFSVWNRKEDEASPSVKAEDKALAAAAPPAAAGVQSTVRELARYWLSTPTLIMLCIAGGIRNAGGYVWGNYTPVFFKYRNVPPEVFASYMGWIPLVAGSLGALFGGFIADKLVNRVQADGTKMGPRGRVLVIMLSNLLAAPFALGALWLPAPQTGSEFPWCFLCLIPSNVIGEMWIGVTLTLVVESVPSHLKATSVALYLFIITNIGGNASYLVPVWINAGASLPVALTIMFPGVYALSSVFFVLVAIFVGRDMARARALEREAAQPLLGPGDKL